MFAIHQHRPTIWSLMIALSLCAALFQTACGSDEQPPPKTGPAIVDLTMDTNQVTPSQGINFTAIVQDDDGLGDIVVARIESTEGLSYVEFEAPTEEETSFSARIDWASANRIEPILFDQDGLDRTLVAKFADTEGNVATQEFTIRLACEDSTRQAACSPGTCVDVSDSEQNCGACGNAVPGGNDEAFCEGGAILCGEDRTEACESKCASHDDVTACGSCDNHCDDWLDMLDDDERDMNAWSRSCVDSACEVWVDRYDNLDGVTCDDVCTEQMECLSAKADYGTGRESVPCNEVPPERGTRWDYPLAELNCRCGQK